MTDPKQKCDEETCTDDAVVYRLIEDHDTDRKYYIHLCLGHAGEFDSYHR